MTTSADAKFLASLIGDDDVVLQYLAANQLLESELSRKRITKKVTLPKLNHRRTKVQSKRQTVNRGAAPDAVTDLVEWAESRREVVPTAKRGTLGPGKQKTSFSPVYSPRSGPQSHSLSKGMSSLDLRGKESAASSRSSDERPQPVKDYNVVLSTVKFPSNPTTSGVTLPAIGTCFVLFPASLISIETATPATPTLPVKESPNPSRSSRTDISVPKPAYARILLSSMSLC